jgi:hypothetical protein
METEHVKLMSYAHGQTWDKNDVFPMKCSMNGKETWKSSDILKIPAGSHGTALKCSPQRI